MVKVNHTKKPNKTAKSKLNLITNNSVRRNKIDKINNKKLKKLSKQLKLNVDSADFGLTENSNIFNSNGSENNHKEHGDGTNNKSDNPAQNSSKKSFSKLFRQSKVQRGRRQPTENTSVDNIPENETNKIISKHLPVVSIQSKNMKQFNDKPDKKPATKTSDSSNGLPKKQANLVVIPKLKRKSYQNGWIVEEMSESGNSIEKESSDSDRDSYLDKFFDDDKQSEHETKNTILTKKRSKPQKSMLLISHSPQTTENSDASSESSQPNFVKLKKRPRKILEEQTSNEIVPYVGPENGDYMCTDSEYDPSWNSSSDDQYEGLDFDNEYIEYSAEEVESDNITVESDSEHDSTDFEYTESEVDELFDECMSDEDTYNSDDDEDYDPGFNDDMYIRRGDAKIFDVHDNNISFNSEEGTQIFEIHDPKQQFTSDNESCPDLVPIIRDNQKSPKSSNNNLNYSVVDDILKDSENEDLNSEDNDDDFLSNISSYLPEAIPSDTTLANKSDEKDHQSDRKSVFYISPISSHLVLLHLKEIIYFHGNFKATLLHGSAKSFGYEFKINKPIEFYSPSCDSLLYLLPADPGKSGKFNTKGLGEYFGQDIIKEITEELAHSSGDAIILLDYYESKRVESIRLYMREEIFPMIHERHASRPFRSSEIRLKTNFIFPDSLHYSGYRKMETEPAWNNISMNPKSKLIVIGGKNVGKSSLIKYLINSNINRVQKMLFIDFDIGQPEIYIPQTISATVIDFPILGSGCFYKVQPKKVLLFGDISVTSEQIKYIHACNTLIQYCTSNEELSAMPWIINTMGYNKGLGDEIIAAYIKTIKPTDVVQINSPRIADNFNQLFTPEFTNQFQFNMFTQEFKDNTEVCSHNFIEIEAFSKMYERNVKGLLSAKDKRLMMILAHLGDILDVSDHKWLTDSEVKKINLNDLHIFTSYSLDKFGCNVSLLKAVLDMTFVYLCNKNNDMSTDTTADCIGVGLVRHVDCEAGILYLITAVSDDDLELVNALALTNVTIAKSILEKQCVLVSGNIKGIGLSDNFIGTRQVQSQTYRPDTTVNTRSNFVKL